jgi:hypothetical protein
MTNINEALDIVQNMNRAEIDSMIYYLELFGWYREDKRKRRSFVNDIIRYNWNNVKSRNEIIRAVEYSKNAG